MTDFEDVIERARRAGLSDPGDPRWTHARADWLPTPQVCSAFVEWATQHHKWQHNVAEVTDRACAKPIEAAIVILSDIVEELLDDDAPE